METFAARLKRMRSRAGLSQRALARASAINPAIVSRFESGDRGPSGPEQVAALSQALALTEADADALLAAAGYWPAVFLRLGPADPTLLAIARLLDDERVGEPDRERFRRVAALLVEQWRGARQRDGADRREAAIDGEVPE